MPNQPRISWPPPGLEPLQAALPPVVRRFALGGLLFTLPLLLAIGTQVKFTSLGPFGTSYWIPTLTSALAVVVLFSAALGASRMLRNAAAGASLGYSWSTLLAVAADETHDSGFVLQGARVYGGLSEQGRRHLLRTRALAPLLYLGATMWLPFALSAALVLAQFELITPMALWWLTLAPFGLLAFLALCARGLEGSLIREAVKQAASEDAGEALAQEALHWQQTLEELRPDDRVASKAPAAPLRFASAMVFVPALLLIAPVLLLGASTLLGPSLAALLTPNIDGVEARIRSAELFRDYQVSADSSVSPLAAGQAFVNLSWITEDGRSTLLRKPTRKVAAFRLHSTPYFYMATDSVGRRMREHRLSNTDRALLRAAVAHSASAEVALLARAPVIDLTGTRWIANLPDTITMWSLPIPRYGGLREGMQVHVLRGYQQYLDGDFASAERSLKEVVSAGLRLLDSGPTSLDGLMGRIVALNGARGLHNLYLAEGRIAEASLIGERIRAADLMAKRSPAANRMDIRTSVALLPEVVGDDQTSRAGQWEAFAAFTSFADCINLKRVVFARNDEYSAWLQKSRTRLVRSAGDSVLFEVAKRGVIQHGRSHFTRCIVPLRVARELFNSAT